MKPRDEKKIDQIFKATLELVSEEGLASITMAKIAKKSKLATGTVYIYFKSKPELLNKLYQQTKKATASRMLVDYDQDQPFKLRLKKLWVNLLKNRLEHFEESFFQEQFYKSSLMSDESKAVSNENSQVIMSLLEEGKEQMLLKDVPNPLLIAQLAGGIRALAQSLQEAPKNHLKSWIDQSFDMAWDAVKN